MPATYALTGDVDADVAARHLEQLSALIASTDAAEIEVDLSGVRMVDTTGMGMLIDAQAQCRDRGKRLVLRGADQRLVRIMQIAGTHELFDWRP